MAIYDTMQFMTCDVATYCIGMAASMGAVLLAAGTKGKRFSLPNSRIMIHQPSGGARGQAPAASCFHCFRRAAGDARLEPPAPGGAAARG